MSATTHPDRAPGVLVLGTSFGVVTHVRALRAAGFDVVGLVGRDAAKARHRADHFGIPHAVTDLDAALALPGVDLVTVATPPHVHAEHVLAAVGAGKHVLCEKPFALDLGQARTMLAAAEAAGVVHSLGAEFRYTTAQAQLRRLVASGRIGEVRTALIVRQMPSLLDPAVELPGWWESEAQGGGWLGAYGSHIIDQVRVTLGEFESVTATLQTLGHRAAMTADDTYLVQFRLVNGCTGVLQSSCTARGPSSATTKIVGAGGAAWIQFRAGDEEVWIDTGAGRQRVPDPDDLPVLTPDPPPADILPAYATTTKWHTDGTDLVPYERIYGRVRDRIAGRDVVDDPPLATFVDGVAQQAVLDACRTAARERRWVDLDQLREDR